MRVLALIAAGEVTGPCRGLYQLIEQAKGHDVQIVLGMFLVRSETSTPSLEEAQRRRFAVEALSQARPWDPWLIPQARNLVRTHRITLLQSHGYKPALVAWCLKRMTGLPWIAFAHGHTTQNLRVAMYNRLDSWLMRRADRVVAVSDATGQGLRSAGVAKSRVRVIRNAIDPSEYRVDRDATPFRREAGAGRDEPLIGVIGRLSPEKGQAVFIQAFRKVVHVVPGAKAVLIGEGQDRVRLAADVRRAGLEGRVIFAGYRHDISSVYAALDLVVIPSLSEGLPNVLLEAMLHRKAVVATAVGGIQEAVQEKMRKWLVAPGDSQALAHAMIDVLSNPSLRAMVGDEGQQQVREVFSPSKRTEQVMRLYHELARSGN